MRSGIAWANAHRLADDVETEMLWLEMDVTRAMAEGRPARAWLYTAVAVDRRAPRRVLNHMQPNVNTTPQAPISY